MYNELAITHCCKPDQLLDILSITYIFCINLNNKQLTGKQNANIFHFNFSTHIILEIIGSEIFIYKNGSDISLRIMGFAFSFPCMMYPNKCKVRSPFLT